MKKLLYGMIGLLVSTYVHAITPEEVLENELENCPKARAIGKRAIEDRTYAPKWDEFNFKNVAEQQQAYKLCRTFSQYLGTKLDQLKEENSEWQPDEELIRKLLPSSLLPTLDTEIGNGKFLQYSFLLGRTRELFVTRFDYEGAYRTATRSCFSLTNPGNITLNNWALSTGTLTGTLDGGSITPGTLTLSGHNTFTGPITVSAGRLIIGDSTYTGPATIMLNTGPLPVFETSTADDPTIPNE